MLALFHGSFPAYDMFFTDGLHVPAQHVYTNCINGDGLLQATGKTSCTCCRSPLHLIETRPQLSQIDPRDLRLMHVMLCTEVNAQCDKLVKVSKVVGETKLTTVATVDVSQRNLN